MMEPKNNMPTVISLEMNELNFEDVSAYAAAGELPTFAHMFDKFGYRLIKV